MYPVCLLLLEDTPLSPQASRQSSGHHTFRVCLHCQALLLEHLLTHLCHQRACHLFHIISTLPGLAQVTPIPYRPQEPLRCQCRPLPMLVAVCRMESKHPTSPLKHKSLALVHMILHCRQADQKRRFLALAQKCKFLALTQMPSRRYSQELEPR